MLPDKLSELGRNIQVNTAPYPFVSRLRNYATRAALAAATVALGVLGADSLSTTHDIFNAPVVSADQGVVYNPPLQRDPAPTWRQSQRLPSRTAQYSGTSWASECTTPHVRNSSESTKVTTVRGVDVNFLGETNSQESSIRNAFVPAMTNTMKAFYENYLGSQNITINVEMLPDPITAPHPANYYTSESQFLDDVRPLVNDSYHVSGTSAGYIELAFIPSTVTNLGQVGSNVGDYGVMLYPYDVITVDNESNIRIREHEAGHGFGLLHNDLGTNNGEAYHDTNSIMNGTNDLYTMTEPVLTQNDANDLCVTVSTPTSTPTPTSTLTPTTTFTPTQTPTPTSTPLSQHYKAIIPLAPSRFSPLNRN